MNALGVSVLMVEQRARQCLAIADYGYVLEQGRNRLAGPGGGDAGRSRGGPPLPGGRWSPRGDPGARSDGVRTAAPFPLALAACGDRVVRLRFGERDSGVRPRPTSPRTASRLRPTGSRRPGPSLARPLRPRVPWPGGRAAAATKPRRRRADPAGPPASGGRRRAALLRPGPGRPALRPARRHAPPVELPRQPRSRRRYRHPAPALEQGLRSVLRHREPRLARSWRFGGRDLARVHRRGHLARPVLHRWRRPALHPGRGRDAARSGSDAATLGLGLPAVDAAPREPRRAAGPRGVLPRAPAPLRRADPALDLRRRPRLEPRASATWRGSPNCSRSLRAPWPPCTSRAFA